MTRNEAIDILVGVIAANSEEENEALDMAIEALKGEDHDGCDGCRCEANDEYMTPCNKCKQNYKDEYKPMPKHDRDWIVGCIKHDGFIKTDRGDKANQIILEALKADRPRGEWIVHNIVCREEICLPYECSNCGFRYSRRFNFCSNCGADMRPIERSEE